MVAEEIDERLLLCGAKLVVTKAEETIESNFFQGIPSGMPCFFVRKVIFFLQDVNIDSRESPINGI